MFNIYKSLRGERKLNVSVTFYNKVPLVNTVLCYSTCQSLLKLKKYI